MHNDDSTPQLVEKTAASLQRIFDDDEMVKSLDITALKAALTERIVDLLLHNMERLLHILYRIDVNEKKVKVAFAQNNPKDIAPLLSELIIEREIQKVISRHKHR